MCCSPFRPFREGALTFGAPLAIYQRFVVLAIHRERRYARRSIAHDLVRRAPLLASTTAILITVDQ